MSIRKLREFMKGWAAIAALVFTGLLLSGCQTTNPGFADIPGDTPAATADPSGGTDAAAAAPAPAESPLGLDLIQTNDSLTITITDIPSPTLQPFDLRVKDDGTITLLQNKIFVAAGKTRGQLEQEIHDAYVPDFYRNMTVTVVKPLQSQFYFVGGEVKRPDRYVYTSRISLLKAIQSAGDFTDFAKKSRVTVNRGTRKFTVDCSKAIAHPELDMEILPGDIVHVPRRIF